MKKVGPDKMSAANHNVGFLKSMGMGCSENVYAIVRGGSIISAYGQAGGISSAFLSINRPLIWCFH